MQREHEGGGRFAQGVLFLLAKQILMFTRRKQKFWLKETKILVERTNTYTVFFWGGWGRRGEPKEYTQREPNIR